MPSELSPEYQAYLLGREWSHVRQDALRLHGDSCMGCREFRSVQLHHVHYPEPITATTAQHLMPLCRECHRAVHRQSEFHPTTRKPWQSDFKRRQIVAYLHRLLSETGESALRRSTDQNRANNPKQHIRRAYFAAFPQVRAAMLAHIAESPSLSKHPSVHRLSDPTLHPDASKKLFSQIIGYSSAATFLDDLLRRIVP